MSIDYKEFVKLVKQFEGWIEGEIARFPTVHQKEEFEKKLSELEANNEK